MKHVFIINPVAGKGIPLKYVPQIKKVFQHRHEEFHIEMTDRPGHATDIARRYASSGVYRIYSVGGDGTVNEILNGMAGSDCSLAVIPGGSGNDFIKSLCRDIKHEDMLLRTIDGKEYPIDLAKVNDRFFVNISSLGFDAEVAYNTNRHKKFFGLRGIVAYMTGVAETLFKYGNNPIKVVVDGDKHIEMDSLLLAVANGRYYGGGMMPAPDAKIDDGKLDLCLIEGKNRLEIMKFFPKFIKGKHADIGGVHFIKGSRIEVECLKKMHLNIDGEIEMVNRAVFEIIPGGIKVVMPVETLS